MGANKTMTDVCLLKESGHLMVKFNCLGFPSICLVNSNHTRNSLSLCSLCPDYHEQTQVYLKIFVTLRFLIPLKIIPDSSEKVWLAVRKILRDE